MKVAKSVFLGAWAMVFAIGAAFADVPAVDVVLVSNARVVVTRADFEMEIERVPDKDRLEFLASRERIGKVLEEILIRKTLADEARELGLDKQPQIRRKMEKAQESVLATERNAHLEKEVDLPDFEMRAKEVYRLNSEKYTEEPMAHAYHVLIGFKDRGKEEALKLAQEVQAQALSGTDFEALAAKYSDDEGSKKRNGDLGYFTREKMVKPFSEAVFALKNGEVSVPVESQFGYHVIKLIDIKPAVIHEYESVKEQIIKDLSAQYLAEFKVKHMTNLRTDKDMKINADEIMKIKTVLPPIKSTK